MLYLSKGFRTKIFIKESETNETVICHSFQLKSLVELYSLTSSLLNNFSVTGAREILMISTKNFQQYLQWKLMVQNCV